MTLLERLRGCGHFRFSHPHFSGVSDTCDKAAARIDALERENAALRKDAERWSYARKTLTWAPSDDGEVKWVMFLAMPEPDVSETGLTPDSVAQELDAAIDAAMAQR